MTRNKPAIVCMGFLLLCSLGCDAKTRYNFLSFFFDGVPAPRETAGETERGKRSGLGTTSPDTRPYVEHGPYAAKLCVGCHDQYTNALSMPVEELCQFCHTFTIGTRKVHGPLASGGCIVCHDPHGSVNPYLLVAEAGEFCLYCHERKDVLKNSVHRDVDMNCTVCHSAHMADNQFLLK